jgi:CheY-like chemotaxis protein
MLAGRDTGCGMPPEVSRHVFEPFFTTKNAGKGSGLGLSVAYGVVQQCGGTIEFDTRVGEGTEFRILLPRIDRPPEGLSPGHRGSALPAGSETILVVEDEETVRNLAVRVLKGLGYNVLAASNAGEAILQAEQLRGPLHLVLTDVVMPRMSGAELIARLSRERQDFRSLYMTGFAPDEVVEVWGTSAPALILKPFAHEELARKVREVLDGPR